MLTDQEIAGPKYNQTIPGLHESDPMVEDNGPIVSVQTDKDDGEEFEEENRKASILTLEKVSFV